MSTVDECENCNAACDCPETDLTPEEWEAKFKENEDSYVPVDAAWLNLQRRKRYIRERNASLATLPPEDPIEYGEIEDGEGGWAAWIDPAPLTGLPREDLNKHTVKCLNRAWTQYGVSPSVKWPGCTCVVPTYEEQQRERVIVSQEEVAHRRERMARERGRWDAQDGVGEEVGAERTFGEMTVNLNGLNEADDIPAILERADDATLLYAQSLNTLYGEPATGKSWIALLAAVNVLQCGGNVLWIDFEDSAQRFVERAKAIGALDYVTDLRAFRFMRESPAESPIALSEAVTWLESGGLYSTVILDAATSGGCPSDGAEVTTWFEKHINPYLRAKVAVLLLDHVPKRKLDRPRGGIGSQHKLAAVNGAALFLRGAAWTKNAEGTVTLINHKDRQGDLPAPMMKPVADVTGQPTEAGLQIRITAPSGSADADLSENLLAALSALGAEGVTGAKGYRALIKGQGKVIDLAMNDLVNAGDVVKTSAGKAWRYVASIHGTALDLG